MADDTPLDAQDELVRDEILREALFIARMLRDPALALFVTHAERLGGFEQFVKHVNEIDASLRKVEHEALPLSVAFSVGYHCADTDVHFTGALLAMIAGRCVRVEGRAALEKKEGG